MVYEQRNEFSMGGDATILLSKNENECHIKRLKHNISIKFRLQFAFNVFLLLISKLNLQVTLCGDYLMINPILFTNQSLLAKKNDWRDTRIRIPLY